MSAEDSQSSFVDANVFVYAIGDDPVRTPIAESLVRRLMQSGALRTSTQVLQELYMVITRKLARTLTPSQALRYLDQIARYSVVTLEYSLIRAAAELSSTDSFSFWDALIVIAAARSGATRLYSEDMQHGRVILGVQIVNPFHHDTVS